MIKNLKKYKGIWIPYFEKIVAEIVDNSVLFINARGARFPFEGMFRKMKLEIQDISDISFGRVFLSTGKGSVPTYRYSITTKRGKQYFFSPALFQVAELKRLLNDMMAINPNIKYSNNINDFLKRDLIVKNTLLFDFKVHRGSFWKNDEILAQDHPLLDTFGGLSFVVFFIFFLFLFFIYGDRYILTAYGNHYPEYRIICVVLGGAFFNIMAMNIFGALFSLYLGHKVSFFSFLAFVGLLCIGLFF